MTGPVVGVGAYAEYLSWEIDDPIPKSGRGVACVIPATYLAAVRRHGGIPVVLPPTVESVPLLDRIDGLVLAGGPDLAAGSYGRQPHRLADRPRLERDRADLAMYRRARDLDLPLLAICRGWQVMVVAEGGTLHQHLPDLGTAVTHASRRGPVEHPIRLAPGTRLAGVYGGAKEITVNSFHHQAVEECGDVNVTAWAADGVVEAGELPGRFCVGVQWHPEAPSRAFPDAPLWDAFLDAAR